MNTFSFSLNIYINKSRENTAFEFFSEVSLYMLINHLNEFGGLIDFYIDQLEEGKLNTVLINS